MGMCFNIERTVVTWDIPQFVGSGEALSLNLECTVCTDIWDIIPPCFKGRSLVELRVVVFVVVLMLVYLPAK